MMIFEQRDAMGGLMRLEDWRKIFLGVLYITFGTFSFCLAFILGIEGFMHTESDLRICTYQAYKQILIANFIKA